MTGVFCTIATCADRLKGVQLDMNARLKVGKMSMYVQVQAEAQEAFAGIYIWCHWKGSQRDITLRRIMIRDEDGKSGSGW
jgi:hypothetical protein